jgi:hypothetical protein
MTYETMTSIWGICVLSAMVIGIILIAKLTYGIIKKNNEQIKSSIKYIINALVCYIFSFYACLSFFLWVSAPIGQTKEESFLLLKEIMTSSFLEWVMYALIITGILLMFNILYQLKFERIKKKRFLALLAFADIVIMVTSISIGALTAYVGLTGEINRFTF